MTKRMFIVGVGASLALSTRCSPNGPNGGDMPTPAPKGTPCGQLPTECFDEFARQPAKIICFREQSRWSRASLTWRLAAPFSGLDEQDQIDAAERAFALWADASNLSFMRVESDADISISFSPRDHGDDFPFDGPGSNLGHAFFPGSGMPGEIHLCGAENWGVADEVAGDLEVDIVIGRGVTADAEFHIFIALVHEIGHALGLEHSLDPDAVMAPNYRDGITELTEDDVDAIQRLYGSPGGDVPSIIERPEAFQEFCADAGSNLTALGDPDTDGDGIPDTIEVFLLVTDPLEADSDGDNVNDFTEVFVNRSDPTDGADAEPRECLFDADCNDGDLCTDDDCIIGACANTSFGCPAGESCDPATGECGGTGCVQDADCDDLLFCNGQETCVNGSCVAGSEPCTASAPCDEDSNVCSQCEMDADCDDGLSCTDNSCEIFGSVRICQVNVLCADNEYCRQDTDSCTLCSSDLCCERLLSCPVCQSVGNCGWCRDNDFCTVGSPDGPFAGSCADWDYGIAECPEFD